MTDFEICRGMCVILWVLWVNANLEIVINGSLDEKCLTVGLKAYLTYSNSDSPCFSFIFSRFFCALINTQEKGITCNLNSIQITVIYVTISAH